MTHSARGSFKPNEHLLEYFCMARGVAASSAAFSHTSGPSGAPAIHSVSKQKMDEVGDKL